LTQFPIRAQGGAQGSEHEKYSACPEIIRFFFSLAVGLNKHFLLNFFLRQKKIINIATFFRLLLKRIYFVVFGSLRLLGEKEKLNQTFGPEYLLLVERS
jgi:hypothetical protein